MIANKITTMIPLEHGKRTKFRVRIQGIECLPDSQDFTKSKFGILKEIADNPALTQCGSQGFQKMTFEYNGRFWELVCEAILSEKDSSNEKATSSNTTQAEQGNKGT